MKKMSIFAISVIATIFTLGTTSCKKEVETIVFKKDTLVINPKPTIVVAQNPLMGNRTIQPGNGSNWVGSYVFQNNSTTDTAIVDVVDLMIQTSAGNTYRDLSINTEGRNSYVRNPKATNSFTLSIILAPGEVDYLNANLGLDAKDTGYVKTSLKTMISWNKGKQKDTLTAQGQTLQIVHPTLKSVSFISNNETAARYIPAKNAAVEASKVAFQLETTDGNVSISRLKFGIVGTQTVSSLKIAGRNFPVINGVVDATDLGLWSYNYIEALVSYPSVGPGGISSGTKSQIILTYINYNDGVSDKVLTPNVASNIMTLVGSVPEVSVFVSNAILKAGKTKAITVRIKANEQGEIHFNSLPIQVYVGSGSVTLGSGTEIEVIDAAGQKINTISTSYVNGISKISFPNGYKIPAGTTAEFEIYVPVISVSSSSALYVSIVGSNDFSWTDVAGGATTPYVGTALIFNYPDYFTSEVRN